MWFVTEWTVDVFGDSQQNTHYYREQSRVRTSMLRLPQKNTVGTSKQVEILPCATFLSSCYAA